MDSSAALAGPVTKANIAATSTREQERIFATIPYPTFMADSRLAATGLSVLSRRRSSEAKQAAKSSRAMKVPARSRQVSQQKAGLIPARICDASALTPFECANLLLK